MKRVSGEYLHLSQDCITIPSGLGPVYFLILKHHILVRRRLGCTFSNCLSQLHPTNKVSGTTKFGLQRFDKRAE